MHRILIHTVPFRFEKFYFVPFRSILTFANFRLTYYVSMKESFIESLLKLNVSELYEI